MIIVRCWLEQLFRCAFECCNFIRGLFNPEMINILFDNDKQIPLQFNIQKANIWAVNTTIENVLKFSLNHLLISEFLNIQMDQVDITEKYTNILLNILINGGNKFPQIYFKIFREINLSDKITEVDYNLAIPRLPHSFFCFPDHFELFCMTYDIQYIIRKSCSS
ncbi:unnamed protein product [Meloidogyne enterolobii]|uniref:Uncharacterized protein n=1 Tax=Meloidogyne enterolobii TaxID=390850 RepID=A0ACB0YPH8_MELEN